jgi:hypothetical protein
MTIHNPTVDDLLTVASNLKSEGQTSRSDFLYTLADDIDKLQADYAALREAAREAINELNNNADRADKFHNDQEAAYDKWLTNRKGGKPGPAVALPIATKVMRSVSNKLAALLNESETES